MKSKLNIVFWTLVLVMFIAASGVVYSKYSKNASSKNISNNVEKKQSQQGDSKQEGAGQGEQKIEAPDFTLKDLNGKEVKLSDFKGKIVILNFWASWCPPCRGEMPDLNELDKELQKGNDAVLLTINATDGGREKAEDAKKYISDNKFTMTVLLDPGLSVTSNLYAIRAFPTTIVVNKDGTIYGGAEGAVTKESMLKVISNIVSESNK